MKRRTLWLVLAVLALLFVAIYAAGSWYFSSIAIASPTQSLEDGRAQAKSFSDYGLPEPEAVSIDAGEVTLAGFFLDNERDGDCGAILLHGFTGTRYGALQYAPLFWERGCDLLLYDARGHGESTPALHTFGYYEKEDLAAAVGWFADRTGLDESDMAVAGVSYGASTALQAAPLLPDVAFILADSAYQDLESILRHQGKVQFGNTALFFLPGALLAAELRTGGDVQAISAQDAIAAAQMPIMLVHSQQDEYTPPSHAEVIYERSDPEQTVLYLNDWGSPHARDILTDYEAYRREFLDFLAAYAPDYGLPPAE
jgi:hypothetical protein